MPMQKATTLLSNIPGIYSRFNKVYCDGRHTHQQIEGEEGGCKRSTWAQKYPDKLCETIGDAVKELP